MIRFIAASPRLEGGPGDMDVGHKCADFAAALRHTHVQT